MRKRKEYVLRIGIFIAGIIILSLSIAWLKYVEDNFSDIQSTIIDAGYIFGFLSCVFVVVSQNTMNKIYAKRGKK